MKFTVVNTDPAGAARTGILVTEHGRIETPVFMPVGTLATVKGLFHKDLAEDVKARIILGNTYHLYLRPGTGIIRKAGGIHKFSGWEGSVLTDSGGYQVFSLAGKRKLSAEGYHFQSHIDGSAHFFSPENVVDIQRIIGADIIMALDECTPGDATYDYAGKSLRLTQNWLERGLARFRTTEGLYGYGQSFFPIVQGCVYPELRRQAAEHAASLDAEGYAIGGLSVGEPTEVMYQMIETVHPCLPPDKPRYLMGVGTPANILEGISRGIDMFDCVMPTRNGRNGMLFTRKGILNIKNRKWADDLSPVDPEGTSFVDTTYSRAYLRHLFTAGEMLGPQIASLHNLAFYLQLVREAAQHIRQGDFTAWKNKMVGPLETRL
ncbi:MAG: tRNA guanosine(34) transglycosylase Tgt [Bacteroidales bacterium]|jgi:queuine tRNA-ribosyltransferase|nr:tRNA guanosine(34) transglycosylase Tgt [Bacteroidales bacterium]MDD2823680.1 tRNA guanosine(34) transglycosylase Tgt [Bacteroidales bacterium]MDD3099975.1 tRNA guanosine(34) transglycosylase Tgt [Bacteroidales bacterium]MDD3638745.1 tRNA guanosine(34) transglycosylase Tgt [Bacteroidales bacterium]MDD3943476.1 tRNA guanosine(34) transglycosylase Tgt [Bacteroidales bacterium]